MSIDKVSAEKEGRNKGLKEAIMTYLIIGHFFDLWRNLKAKR